MSSLLSSIQSLDEEAARVLQEEEFCTDADIKTLNRIDLNELFPGPENLKLRKRIFDTVHVTNPEVHGKVNKLIPEKPIYGASASASSDPRKKKDGPNGDDLQSAPDTTEPDDAMETDTSSTHVLCHSKTAGNAMTSLLWAIKDLDKDAALVLKKAGFCTDADVETLNQIDLNELFPGREKLKLRKRIFDTVHKHVTNQEFLGEEKKLVPGESLNGASTLASSDPVKKKDGTNGDHLERAPDTAGTNDAMETGTSSTPGPYPSIVDPYVLVYIIHSEAILTLLLDIKSFSEAAALVLEGFCTDALIETLTQEDLSELFPGDENIELRTRIFDTVHKHLANHERFGEENKLAPGESLSGPNTSSSSDPVKKDDGSNGDSPQKAPGPNTSSSSDPVKKDDGSNGDSLQKAPDNSESDDEMETGTGSTKGGSQGKSANTSSVVGPVKMDEGLNVDHPQRAPEKNKTDHEVKKPTPSASENGSPIRGSLGSFFWNPFTSLSPQNVKYKKVVSGETFGADQEFMKKVKAQLQGVVQLTESRDDHQITMLFCSITSRVGSDVEAAMAQVTDDKPIILVLMHHSHEAKVTTSVRTWDLDANYTKIIHHELFPPRSEVISGQSNQAVQRRSGRSSNATDSDDTMESEPFTSLSPQNVKYKKVANGETFGADQGFMDKVKAQLQGVVQLTESRVDHQITMLFCSVTSRAGSDVDAAMAQVTDDKPIILVLMHHSYEPKVTTSVRTWDLDANYTKITFHVDVFFHSTAHGLLKCQQNDAAVSHIQMKLQELFPPRSEVISGQSNQVVVAKRAKTSVIGGSKDDSSDKNSSWSWNPVDYFKSRKM